MHRPKSTSLVAVSKRAKAFENMEETRRHKVKMKTLRRPNEVSEAANLRFNVIIGAGDKCVRFVIITVILVQLLSLVLPFDNNLKASIAMAADNDIDSHDGAGFSASLQASLAADDGPNINQRRKLRFDEQIPSIVSASKWQSEVLLPCKIFDLPAEETVSSVFRLFRSTLAFSVFSYWLSNGVDIRRRQTQT